MKTTYEYCSIDQAIEKLQNLKKKNKKYKILICTIDYDQKEEMKKLTTPEEGCELVRKAKSVFMNEGEVFEHVQLISIVQDLENMRREGVTHDIILPHLKE